MLLNDCKIGINQEALDLEVVSITCLTSDLLKLNLRDSSSRKVNFFIESAKNISFFRSIKEGTWIKISNFIATQNFTQISQYFPAYIPGMSVAIHNSDCDFYILISEDLPNIILSYNTNSIELQSTTNIGELNLSTLYEMRFTIQAPLEKSANSKYCNLKTAFERIGQGQTYISCYAIIVDSTGSYMPKNSEISDYLVTLKITDPSIFPNIANVNIFHNSPKDFPKISNFGDIIKLNEVSIKDYLGILQVTIPCTRNRTSASFLIFSYTGESLVPYVNYRASFHNSNDHSLQIKKLSDWGYATLAHEPPLFIKNTKRLCNTSTSEEIDIITRIVGIYSLGMHENDPKVCLCADTTEVCQLIIPEEKMKMLKYIEKNDVVRIRSVIYEDKVLYLNHYSDILRIPNEFKSMIIPATYNNEELNRYLRLYSPPSLTYRLISIVSDTLKFSPLTPFTKILNNPVNSIIRLEGFIVKISISKGIDFILWDGDKEQNIVKLHLPEENVLDFLNGKTWENAKQEIEDVIGIDASEAVIIFFKLQ